MKNIFTQFFNNQDMSRKILSAPAVVFLFLIILALVSYIGLSQQRTAINDIYSIRFGNYQDIATIVTKVNAIHSDIYKMLTWSGVGIDKARIEATGSSALKGIKELQGLMLNLQGSDKLNPKEKDFYQSALKELNEYAKLAEDTIDLSADPGAAVVFMISLEDQYQALKKTLQELWELENRLSKESYIYSTASMSKVLTIFSVVLTAAIIFSIIITLLCVKAIISPVKKTIDILNSYVGTASSSVGRQADFSMQLSSSVIEISSTMEEFSATANSIAINGRTVAEKAGKTLEDTLEGAACVETLTAKMNEISQDNEVSIREILDLGKRSNQINKIMEIINNIANQTKLIAFNASLEASSAGEAGKRFGVVAVEIRRLADSVFESTKEIEGEISQIMDSVNRLVLASEKSSKGIREGLDFSKKTVHMLEAIVEEVKTTSDASRQISQSTQQQVVATAHVATALMEIQEGVRITSDTVQETNLISQNLSETARKLESLVGKFRLQDTA